MTESIVKLILGTAVFAAFVLITRLGLPRLTGLLLTFPVLNGVGLVSLADKSPKNLANGMYPMMAINAVLFVAIIFLLTQFGSRLRLIPNAWKIPAQLVLVGVFGVAWFFLAVYAAPLLLLYLPNGGYFFAIYFGFAVLATRLVWRSKVQSGSAQLASPHDLIRKLGFYLRIILFVIALGIVVVAAGFTSDEDWLGKLSALPLPGIFALAAIAIDSNDDLKPIGDTVLFGPLVAMVFVWSFSLAMLDLRQSLGLTLEFYIAASATLVVGWIVMLLATLGALPWIEKLYGRRGEVSAASR